MDKFESMRAFIQVVEAGGFAAAARQMLVSRSAVNKLVHKLENELGVQLLHRSTRKVTPTATGLAFYQRCRAILADVAEAEQAVAQLQAEPRGALRINTPMTFGIQQVGPAIATFAARYPQLQIQLTLEDRFIDPIAEGYDAVIRITADVTAASIIARPLAAAPRLVCAAPSYLAQHGSPTHPDELKHHACLHYGYLATGNSWQLQQPSRELLSVSINSAFCSNNGDVLKTAALQGLGIALLPRFIIETALETGQLQPILTDFAPSALTVFIVYPVNRHLSTKVQLLADFLAARFSQVASNQDT
ncbi:MAG: LysR family transcriptional regulator [Cyanobacteria bacterium P01_A01_bin.105]